MKRYICLLVFLAQVVYANPIGENVITGEVDVYREGVGELHLHQKTDKAIIEWEDFSINSNEQTRFSQPSTESITLNKVVGPNISEIYGKLEANGQIVLINPHGVIVGETGVINTAAFLAPSKDVSYDDFLEGSVEFPLSDVTCMVNVEGRVEATKCEKVGGRIFLVADEFDIDSELIAEGANLGSLENETVLSKYRNSGFGKTYVARSGVSSGSSTSYIGSPDQPAQTQNTLCALQELRTDMPERLWMQEFSILSDSNAYAAHLKTLMEHQRRDKTIQSSFAIADSNYYILRSTLSGEYIRLRDFWEEFVEGPFWRTPEMMSQLDWWEGDQ